MFCRFFCKEQQGYFALLSLVLTTLKSIFGSYEKSDTFKKPAFQPLIAVLITVVSAQLCTFWTNILCWTNVVMISNDVHNAYKTVI